MNFSIEQNKQLIAIYPYLQPRNLWTGEIPENYDYSYIRGEELPDGWHKLFLMYCKEMRPHLIKSNMLDKFQFSQIKEKYGTMRIYNCGYPKSADYLTSLYEYYSTFVCQRCGKPSKWVTKGWVSFFCDECIGEAQVDCYPLKKQTSMRFTCYKNNEPYRISYTYKYLDKEYKRVLCMTDDEFFDYITDVTEKY